MKELNGVSVEKQNPCKDDRETSRALDGERKTTTAAVKSEWMETEKQRRGRMPSGRQKENVFPTARVGEIKC